jgi:hypothetical protein
VGSHIFSRYRPMHPEQVLWGPFLYQKLDSGAMNLQKSGLYANLAHEFGIKYREKLEETEDDPSGVCNDWL